MNNDCYNGLFTVKYSITVEASTHEMCLHVFNRIKRLVDALNFGDIVWHDTKSARKGPVLSRWMHIQFKGYASDVLIFRSTVDHQMEKIRFYYPSVCVILHHVETLREDTRLDLGEETV